MEKSAKNIYREKKTTNIYCSSMPTNNIVPFLFPAKCHSFPSKLHLFPLQEIEHMVDTVLEMLPCMDWKAFQHAPKEKLLIIFFFPIYFGEREREWEIMVGCQQCLQRLGWVMAISFAVHGLCSSWTEALVMNKLRTPQPNSRWNYSS